MQYNEHMAFLKTLSTNLFLSTNCTGHCASALQGLSMRLKLSFPVHHTQQSAYVLH